MLDSLRRRFCPHPSMGFRYFPKTDVWIVQCPRCGESWYREKQDYRAVCYGCFKDLEFVVEREKEE